MAKIPGQSGEWRRVSGEYSYFNTKGELVIGRGEHMQNILSGDNLTIRQFQNQQREARELQGLTPKEPRQKRENLGNPYYTRRREHVYHGKVVEKYFRDLNEAQLWFISLYQANDPLLDTYKTWLIQARFQSRNTIRFGTSKEDPRKPSNYTTLTDRYYDLMDMALTDTPWIVAGNRLEEGFTLGENGAIILLGAEK